MRPNNNLVFTNKTAATSGNSVAQWAWDIVRASFQVVLSGGTGAGAMKVQASNDKAIGLPANQFQPTNWNDITGATVTVTGPGTFLILPIECSYEYIRLVYTDSSGGTGTGVINARMHSKAL